MVSTSHCALLSLLLLVVSSRALSVPGTDDDAALESLLPPRSDERQLRHSILCRCVANDETFYETRRLNKYYQYDGSVKAGPKSVFDMSSDQTSDEQDEDAAPTPSQRNMRPSGRGRSMTSVFGGSNEDESSSDSGPRGSSTNRPSSGRQGGGSMMRVMSVFGHEDAAETNARAPMRMNRGMHRPMSVFGMGSAGRTNEDDDTIETATTAGGYYETQYTSSAQMGADGLYIVNGITVLPMDDQACMVSQTNAALRAFLELMYRPQDTTSRTEFWDLFHSRRRLEIKESAKVKDERELRGWEERRKRAQQNRRKKNMRDRNQYDTDLSGGAADFVPRDIHTVFPCPNALPVMPPSMAPIPATDSPVATETDSPVAMETETPTLEPTENIIASDGPSIVPSIVPVIASDFPSLTPSTNIETLNPTSLPTFSVEPTSRVTSRPTMRMMRTLAPVPVAPTPAPTRRIMSVLPPPTRRPSGRMMRTPRPTSIAPSSFSAAPSPGPSVTTRPNGSTTPVVQSIRTPSRSPNTLDPTNLPVVNRTTNAPASSNLSTLNPTNPVYNDTTGPTDPVTLNYTQPAEGAHVWLRADLDVNASRDTEQACFWGDQSGQENHAFMPSLPRCPTVAYNAVNGHPVIRFNGSQSFQLTTPLSYPDMTIFVVGKNSQTSDAFSMILGPGGMTPNNQLRWEDGSSVLAVGTGNSLPIITATIGDTRVYHALAVGYNGTSIQFYRDGIQVSSDITNFETTDPWILYLIGAWYSTYYMTGDLAEMLVYPTVLSDADRARTDAYLRARYALP